MLLPYGLGQDKGGPWLERFGPRPAKLLEEELWSAARRNLPERVKLLVEHGVAVNAPGRRDGRTPYQAAMLADNQEIAAYLLQHGADKIDLDPEERFAVACIAGHRADAMALLQENPKLMEKLGPDGRIKLMHRAVEANRPEGIRLMAELGFETSGMTRHDGVGLHLNVTPLHNAAGAGNLEMVKLLMDLGAEPNLLEPNFHATPLGWAAHGKHRAVVEYLLPFATIFDAVQGDGVERAAALLQKEPSLANAADQDGRPLVFYLHAGLKRLDEMIDLLRTHGADLSARDRKGRTLLDEMRRRGSDAVAERLRGHGARTAQELTPGILKA
jgi:ankyrin repeat protein